MERVLNALQDIVQSINIQCVMKTVETRENTWLFESSWEVCNRVGGIYTVLSTHAKQLAASYGDRLCFIGPDIDALYPSETPNALFSEESTPLDAWAAGFDSVLKVRTGRWNIPGRPVAVLVDFRELFSEKDNIYACLWDWFRVDSLHAYGDYDEACMFAWACGMLVESISRQMAAEERVIAHFHEWTTGVGLLYCKRFLPAAATVFTTHATSIGRSICGNGKMLYAYMKGYQGDQMAAELNMQSKHSVEKTAAHEADCFTTVSRITARECEQLLDKAPDVVTPNGFEDDFVLPAAEAAKMRRRARARLLEVAEATLGYGLPADSLLLATAGRYEYRNKGLDIFLDMLNALSRDTRLQRTVVAYILVPGNVSAPRQEVLSNLESIRKDGPAACQPVWHPFNTHWMHQIESDSILNRLKQMCWTNRPEDRVKIVFVPCYLHGNDGIFQMNYYDLLQGFDLTAFLSYYEPWGYTPLESVAFSIPTLTTSLSGFGQWCLERPAQASGIGTGVAVIERNDGNCAEVVTEAADTVLAYSALDEEAVKGARKAARSISRDALWTRFVKYYHQAYKMALDRAAIRNKK